MKSPRASHSLISKAIQGLLIVALLSSISCARHHFVRPVVHSKLKVKLDNRDKTIKLSGTADRLENDEWALVLSFDDMSESDIKDTTLVGEPYTAKTSEKDGKLFISWEIPKERWLNADPFGFVLTLNDDSNSQLVVKVKHKATLEKHTVLAYVVGFSVLIVLQVGGIPLLESILF